jgi:hypothetical protein
MGILDNLTSDLKNGFQNSGLGRLLGYPQTANAVPPQINFKNSAGDVLGQDHRVRIQVPTSYLTAYTSGGKTNALKNLGGIIFPYTPQITVEEKADYTNSNQMHSNFSQHFYQRSQIGSITITGKFTVQNSVDAEIYLSTLQLLRALIKMRANGESYAGSPPPVCRLSAWGSYMIKNVPVAITSFRSDLPENVDYFSLSPDSIYKDTMVPTVSTITLNLMPMFSRAEQQAFTVSGWLNGNLNGKGYL